ncbi:MAG: hypothetical protein WKG06_29565 [Segetibacter sp.]
MPFLAYDLTNHFIDEEKYFLFLIFLASASIAQPIRLHVMGGFSNYSGDIRQQRFTLDQAAALL